MRGCSLQNTRAKQWHVVAWRLTLPARPTGLYYAGKLDSLAMHAANLGISQSSYLVTNAHCFTSAHTFASKYFRDHCAIS